MNLPVQINSEFVVYFWRATTRILVYALTLREKGKDGWEMQISLHYTEWFANKRKKIVHISRSFELGGFKLNGVGNT